jgi:hypothetical protein
MHAVKPDITETIIDAYWKTLDVNSKEDGLSMFIDKSIKIKFHFKIDLKQFNELLFNLNFDLKQRNADQTVLQKTCPSIYNSKPSRVIIDFVNTA